MKRLAVLVATGLLVSGCGGFAGLNDLPLPGGAKLGAHPVHVRIELRDTDNLARQAAVKVDDVTVGTVESITLHGWQPEVDVVLAEGTELPANAIAAVRQTGLLGEKYVELATPADAKPIGRLADGALIGLDRTTTSVEVEEVLGALSLLLNGGGIDRVRTITVELRKAMDGRTGEFRGLLSELDGFTAQLDANKTAIVQALTGLDRLTTRLRQGRQVIAQALDAIGPALSVLADQRKQLTTMLTATTRLAQVGGQTIVATQHDLVASLDSLAPALTKLAQAGDDLPKALEFMLSFPFPDKGLSAFHGDYVNAHIQLDLSLPTLVQLLTGKVPK